MDPLAILSGVVPPIVAAVLLVSFCGARLLPLAVGIGLDAVYGLLMRRWPLLPHELWRDPNGVGWLVWSLVGAGVIAVLEHLKALPTRALVAAGLALAAAAVWLVLGKVAMHWQPGDVRLYVGGGGVVALLSVVATRDVLRRAPVGVAPAILFVLVLAFDAVLMVQARSALLAQLCGAVAAALGAAVGTALWRRSFTLGPADGVWLGAAHALFVLAAVHLAYLPLAAGAVALLAPLLMLLVLLLPRPSSGERPWRWFAVRAAPAAVLPLAVALWLSIGEGDPSGY